MATNNILRTFRVDSCEWDIFLGICEKNGISASQALKSYISQVVKTNKIDIQEPDNKEDMDPISAIQSQLDAIYKRLEVLER